MTRPYDVTRVEETTVGRFTIVRDEIHINGKDYSFSYEKGKDCVVILPIIGNHVILIRQYRHALGDWFWEIPAGGIEIGETPEGSARKELREEAGCEAEKLIKVGEFPVSLGTSGAWAHVFIAKCGKIGKQNTEATEMIEVHMVSEQRFEEMISDGEFLHMAGIIAWNTYKNRKGLS